MRRLSGVGTTSSASQETVFTLTPPPNRLWWLKDGHFGWSGTNVVALTGAASAQIHFTFEDGSTHDTAVVATPWSERIFGPLSGDGSLLSRISKIEGILTADGTHTANLVGNFVVEEVVSPTLVPAPGPRFWFKADAGVTKSGSDVTAWADQSGNGFDVSDAGMPGGSRHLQFNASSTNGLPGLTGSQGLTPQALIYTAGNVYTGGAPRTVFAVVKFGGTGTFGSTGGFVFTFRRSAPEFGLGVFQHGPPDPPGHQVLYTDFNAPTTIEATVPVDYSGQAVLLRWQTDVAGTHLSVFDDGVAIATGTDVLGGESGNTGFIVGSLINDDGHAVFEGDINEIIGYDGVLSGSDIAATEAYLSAKWGL